MYDCLVRDISALVTASDSFDLVAEDALNASGHDARFLALSGHSTMSD